MPLTELTSLCEEHRLPNGDITCEESPGAAVVTGSLVVSRLAVPPWWVLPVGLVLSLAALSVDSRLTHLLTDTNLHHRFWRALILVEPLIGVAILFVCLTSYPTRERTWMGIAIVCGALLVNSLLAVLLARIAPSSGGADAIRFVQGAVGWALILGLLGLHINGVRLCKGFLAAVLLSTAVTHLLKWAIGRARPKTDLGLLHFEPFHGGLGELESFPSGHSSAAATLAALLGIYFPRARPLFYVFALVVGLSRVVADKHYLSDVLAGFVVGIAAVLVCIRALGERFYQRGSPQVSD